ncbi:MAG: hypothetical protein MR802_03250 [Prevotella sp.]|nr:hypothetical protein [Prevotella sp.]
MKQTVSLSGQQKKVSTLVLDLFFEETNKNEDNINERSFIQFWHGLTALLAGIANLFAAMWVNMSNRQEPTHLNMLSSWDKIC